jgi:xylose isomerase
VGRARGLRDAAQHRPDPRGGAGRAVPARWWSSTSTRSAFKGTILIEPKPQEPTKHQYDYDVATVYGFLKRFGLENEVKVNIEQGHAILAGHSFEHELALAASLGMFGSIDMNRNDYQSGWDTDQFPNNVPEMALAYYEILKAGGFTTGGTNFDAKLRRQSLDPEDLILAHVGGMDVCARGLKAAMPTLPAIG